MISIEDRLIGELSGFNCAYHILTESKTKTEALERIAKHIESTKDTIGDLYYNVKNFEKLEEIMMDPSKTKRGERMKCTTCYYANERYDRDGVQIGVDCAKDNMRFIPLVIAKCQYCGAYAERD